jgi:hypothetical protein
VIFNTRQRAINSDLSIIVTRADGTVEDLGVVYRSFKNPLKQLAWNVRQYVRRHLGI